MRMKRRLAFGGLLLITGLLVLLGDDVLKTLQLSIMRYSTDMDYSCYSKISIDSRSLPNFDDREGNDHLSSGKNIFFHETSCFNDVGEAKLNCRQACAVESAARMNPGMSVNLLYLSHSPPSNYTSKLIKQLTSYKNFRVARVYVDEYFRDTPIEHWYAGGALDSSYWPRSHMSDIMRYITLWKFGGIYLDLDVVVTTSLEDLEDFAGAEDHLDVAAGVIGLSLSRLGRTVANACVQDLMKNFLGNIWGNNGPGVITRTLQRLCGVQHVRNMTPTRCNGFVVYPPSAFYPIFYDNWQRYFTTDDFNETMRIIDKARAIHVWNKLSGAQPIKVGSKVPYAVVAEKYCPKIYNNCGSTF